jgi:type VI secretion system VasD/TssJ family lipoprotein
MKFLSVHTRKKIILHLLFITLLILLGCGGKETIKISLASDKNTNNGNAVVITVFQLTNAEKFRFSSFESLSKNPEATLETDLVTNSKLEKTMVPEEIFELNDIELKEEAAFIGIIADFYSPAPDGLKKLILINQDFERLIIYIHENSISIETDN